MGTAKSVASQTLALTRCVALPALSRLPAARAEPRALWPAAAAPPRQSGSRPSCRRGLTHGLARKPPQSRLSLSRGVAAVSGQCCSTSEVPERVSASGTASAAAPASKRSREPTYSEVSADHSLVFEASRLRPTGVSPPLNSSRSSGRQASGGKEQPKYSWKVMQLPCWPFFLTDTPKVPRTSKRMDFQPLTSQRPALVPSQDVAFATSRLSTCMSHCIASADTRSPRTAPASSAPSPSVTSTTVCFAWLSMQRVEVVRPGAPSDSTSPRKSVVRLRRLLKRNFFHEASVESMRNIVPCLRSQTTSDGAILFSKGSTGDSNSHLILHSKSGSKRKELEMEPRRFSQRNPRCRCVPSKSMRVSFSSPRLTASSSGDQPCCDRSRGSASHWSSC
mmetsp:Transcript_43654/g.139055  ORF Transcript_43654/g.139055 Transcript_43654/m.139055 type:complete len:392 (+) Transcript_43654:421-1596(+)